MRKNRKMTKKMSVMAGRSAQAASVLIMAFAMVILYMLANSSCKQLNNDIRAKERELARLENEYKRESARWDEMTIPEKLEKALLHHGLSMHTPKPEQTVRMKSDGSLYPGQVSVSRAAERNEARKMKLAGLAPVKRSARAAVTSRVRR